MHLRSCLFPLALFFVELGWVVSFGQPEGIFVSNKNDGRSYVSLPATQSEKNTHEDENHAPHDTKILLKRDNDK